MGTSPVRRRTGAAESKGRSRVREQGAGTGEGIAPIGLGADPAQRWAPLTDAASAVGRDPVAALGLADRVADEVPLPGAGDTLGRWSALATLGATDLAVARALEPHLDAVAILAEAGREDLATPGSTWGVFAAEGPGRQPEAAPDDRCRWRLDGVKPWCSLAGDLTHALVTAWCGDRRGLFGVELLEPAVEVLPGEEWPAHGLAEIRSTPVRFVEAPAQPVREPDWYLDRDGFAWGGIGVAAIWYGAGVALLRRMQRQASERQLDQVGEMLLGRADVALSAARAVLADSARAIDEGAADGERGATLALRTRQVVHDAVESTLRGAAHGMGPAPLTREREHLRRVSDLGVYLRQHHAERDQAALGRRVAAEQPW
ncbi:acyl-CoA dehydrogenase [Nocardioides sp. GY 10113]|uniref:acyl-CoA dehydrogenase n=1 Tax=Nocardioides sp. GY 10113 TaxID=2569761 RepID=UPI0019802A79|nr:acyl-CoA dehydrogenase [Nocardioides sp. GY 10113]